MRPPTAARPTLRSSDPGRRQRCCEAGEPNAARSGANGAGTATSGCTTRCASGWSPSATTTGSRPTPAYKVDGKALRLRKTLIFEDPDGHKLAKIQERVARIKDSMEIEDDDGHRVAMVKKALISPLRDRWTVTIGNGPDLEIQGNVLDHEYTVTDGRTPVATVSKRWFRVADTYGVEIDPEQDPVVVLAATVAVDMMAHEDR
jgi:uncharacterized protein YxjI